MPFTVEPEEFLDSTEEATPAPKFTVSPEDFLRVPTQKQATLQFSVSPEDFLSAPEAAAPTRAPSIPGMERLGGVPPGPATPPRPALPWELQVQTPTPGAEKDIPQRILDTATGGIGKVAQGIERVAAPLQSFVVGKPGEPGMPRQSSLTTEGAKELAKGGSEILGGTLQAATPLVMGSVGAAPLHTLVALAAGTLAQKGAKAGLDALGVAPEYSDLASDIAGLLAAYGLAGHGRLSPEQQTLIEVLRGKDAPAAQARTIDALKATADRGGSEAERNLARAALKRKFGIVYGEETAEPSATPAEAPAVQPVAPTATQVQPQAATVPEPAKPVVAEAPAAVTVQPGSTYKTRAGEIIVTHVGNDTVTFDQALPDGSVIKGGNLPMHQFVASVAPKPATPAVAPATQVAPVAQAPQPVGTSQTPAPVIEPAPPTNLTEVGGGMAGGIKYNMYAMLWDKVRRGETTEAGGPSTLLQAAKIIRDSGGMQSIDDMKSLAADVAQAQSSPDFQSAMRAVILKHQPSEPAPAPQPQPIPVEQTPTTPQLEPQPQQAPQIAPESTEPPATPAKEVVQPEPQEAVPEAAGEKATTHNPPSNEEAKQEVTPAAETKPKPHKYASTQVNLPADVAEKSKAFAATIPKESLMPDGIEQDPHITLRFGNAEEDDQRIRAALAKEGPITAKIKGISIFPNVDTEHGKADVVKLDIESPDLRRLNALVGKAVPHPGETFPNYKPHVTIAYLRAGEGKKYAGRSIPGLSGQEITFNSVAFSPKSGEMTEIPLTAAHGKVVESKESTQPNQEEKQESGRTAQIHEFESGGDAAKLLSSIQDGDTIKAPGGIWRVDRVNRFTTQSLRAGAAPRTETLSVSLRDQHGNIKEYRADQFKELLDRGEKKPVTPQVPVRSETKPPVAETKPAPAETLPAKTETPAPKVEAKPLTAAEHNARAAELRAAKKAATAPEPKESPTIAAGKGNAVTVAAGISESDLDTAVDAALGEMMGGVSQETTPAVKLSDEVYRKLSAGDPLGNQPEFYKTAERFFGSPRSSGAWDVKDAMDAMEAGVNRLIIERGKRWLEMEPTKALAEIRKLMTLLPTQGIRTGEQLAAQQFSTPPTEAYVAAVAAGLKPDDVFLEPSAGNGGLASFAKAIGAKVHVNEISDRRAAMLESVGFDKPTAHDGELINALLDPSVRPTVIVMNPPFSAGILKSNQGKNRNQYGFNHVDQALQRLAQGGRLVAILGGGRADDLNGGASFTGGSTGQWFDKVRKIYNIRANVRINGKEYQKYGTSFATRIIVIDKTGPTPNWPEVLRGAGGVVQGNANTLEEAYTLLKDVANDRPEAQIPSGVRGAAPAGEREPGTGVATGTRPSGERGGALPAGRGGIAPAGEPSDRPPELGGGPRGNQPSAGAQPAGIQQPGSGPQPPSQTTLAGGPESGTEPNAERPVRGGGEPGQKPNPLAAARDAARTRLQGKYRGTQLNAGIDPQDLIDLATIGAANIIDGSVKFNDWRKRLMTEMGDLVKAIAKNAGISDDDCCRQVFPVSSRAAAKHGVQAEPLPERTEAPAEQEKTPAPKQKKGQPQKEQALSGDEGSAGLIPIERVDAPLSEKADTEAYVAYHPTLKGSPHPGDIVETKTMATVPVPAITTKLNLPANVGISAVQLEAVAIAKQSNEVMLPGGFRAAALIGDGTGVGKGREAAAYLWENLRSGRKRLVWISEKWDLMQDAMRDLSGIGAQEMLRGVERAPSGKFNVTPKSAIQPFNRWGYGAKIAHDGMIFSTYGTVRAKDKKGNRRVAQLEEYLRGSDDAEGAAIVFDEAHNLKNAVPARGTPPSQIGMAVKQLLENLPNLRTVSLSATAATDVVNLGYLDRLGSWGPGTSFPNGFSEFQVQIARGGLSAMEMIARELKAQGRYLSRTLSFHGVEYSTEEHKLSDEQKDLYRTATKAWGVVLESAGNTIATTTNGGGQALGNFLSQFYGAQQRFFNLLITTLKIPTCVELANQALADGKAVVITLVNTNEAAQNREKNKARDEDDDDEIPDYDFGPKEMLKNLIKDHYPTQQWADDVNDNGDPIKVPVYTTDADGREIALQNPDAIAARDALIDQIDRDLHMPDNPLDILIQSLGGERKVAELTGRKERYDRNVGKFVPRGDPGVPQKDTNLLEMRNFQSGKKDVAVLSGAAGTGISLHAGNDVANKKQRYHITLQVGWSADKAQQMFGRTHRTNQVQPPEYVFLVSDLGGEKRFVSTISRRLGSLGALTKGQKNATGGNDLMEKVNFETDQGRQATNTFYERMLMDQPVPGAFLRVEEPGATDITTGHETQQQLTGRQILSDLHVLKASGNQGQTVPPAERTNVTRLLNRMLALDPDIQNAVYNYFYDIFQATVQDAINRGTLDTGVKTLPGDEFEVKESRVISTDPKTGAETFYYPVDAKVRTHRVSPAELTKRMVDHATENPVLMVNDKGKIALIIDADPIVHADGRVEPAFYSSTPDRGKWRKIGQYQLPRGMQEVKEKATEEVGKAEQAVKRAESSVDYRKREAERSLENEKSRRSRIIQDQINRLKVRLPGLSGQDAVRAQAELATAEADLAKVEDFAFEPTAWATVNVRDAEGALSEAKTELDKAKDVAKDPIGKAKEQWAEQYEEAPAHITESHHFIGGAVLRFWNPISDIRRPEIFTAVDSKTGKRVVGVDIPAESIRDLLARITGGASTVNASQLITDVLRNGLSYTLEGGIQVRQGRIGRDPVIQLIPPNKDVARVLQGLGVGYEKGLQPIYYVPNQHSGPGSGRQPAIVERILQQYPVKAEPGAESTELPSARGLIEEETGTSTVAQAVRRILDRFKKEDEENPGRRSYSRGGHLKRVLAPGARLAEVEQASKPVFEKALTAGSWQSIASTMTRTAVSAINKTLDGSESGGAPFNWLRMRQALTEDRLLGLRDRWNEFADTFQSADEDQVKELMTASAEDGRSFFLDVLENIEGRQGMGQDLKQTAAALIASEDWDVLGDFVAQSFFDAASSVASLYLNSSQFDGDLKFLESDPKGKAAMDVYRKEIEEPLAKAHEENEGVFGTKGKYMGSYIPLVPFEPKPPELGGRRLPLHKPKNPDMHFATGLSESYSLTMPGFVDRIGKSIRANSRAGLIETLRDTGWSMSKPRNWDGTFTGPDGIVYKGHAGQVSEARTILKDGKPLAIPGRQDIVPEFIWEGLQPMLEKEAPNQNDLTRMAHWLNTLALKATPAELAYHSKGVLGAINANTPFLGTTGLDKFLSAPVLRWFAIPAKLLSINPESPENVKKIREMAEAGATPGKLGAVTFSKSFAEEFGVKHEVNFGTLLYGPSGIDARARVLMYDIFKAAYGGTKYDTKEDLHHFVNQIGNYTPEFQGEIERFFKRIGVGPFATAGMTRLANSAHAYTGTGPGSPKMRFLQMFLGGAVAGIGLWALSYHFLTGKWPTQDKRAKLMQLPVSVHGDGILDKLFQGPKGRGLGTMMWGTDWVSGKTVGYLNYGTFFPLVERGARLFGMTNSFEAHQLGGSRKQIIDAAEADVANSLAHPFIGPAATAAWVFGTGTEPYLTKLHDRGRPAPQLLPAFPDQRKPGFFGGLTPGLVGGQEVRNPGAASEQGAKLAATVKALNGFYGQIGEGTGLLGPDHGNKGAWWFRMATDLAAPGLVKNASNPFAKAEMLRKSRAAGEK